MSKIWVLLAVLLSMPGALSARARPFGAGIIVGSPTGISAKYWLSPRNAFAGALSVDSAGLYLHVDYLWHDYRAFPRPEEGQLPLYYGVGAAVHTEGNLGIRGIVGIEYLFEGYPFDLFLELAPVLTVGEDTGFGFSGGLGGRYYFGASLPRGRR